MTFSEILLPEFDEEMKNTRKILECVPDGKFDYKPHAKSMELGRLAGHIAEMPSWAESTLDTELLEIGADFKPDVLNTRAEILKKFDNSVGAARKKIAAASDDDWKKTWTLRFGGKEIISMPKTVAMRNMVMSHMIHHRAQLGVYLRLNEIAIPGMYGASADEPKWWEAKA